MGLPSLPRHLFFMLIPGTTIPPLACWGRPFLGRSTVMGMARNQPLLGLAAAKGPQLQEEQHAFLIPRFACSIARRDWGSKKQRQHESLVMFPSVVSNFRLGR